MARGPVSAAYGARRAAALAGVPERTVYYWAQTGLVVPSVSRSKTMLWSYADLLVLRLIEWLRRGKHDLELPPTPIGRIRSELDRIENLGEKLMERGLTVRFDPRGRLVFEGPTGFYVHLGREFQQEIVPTTAVNLVRPFLHESGRKGPDLVIPRTTLRIIPGKLSGEPHVLNTRIETRTLAALAARGLDETGIRELYPMLEPNNVSDALELEDQLARAA